MDKTGKLPFYTCLQNAFIHFGVQTEEEAVKAYYEKYNTQEDKKSIKYLLKKIFRKTDIDLTPIGKWWNAKMNHSLDASIISFSHVMENDALRESLKRVHNQQSVIILPKDEHAVLIYNAGQSGGEFMAHVHDPWALEKINYYGMESEDIWLSLIKSHQKYVEITKKDSKS